MKSVIATIKPYASPIFPIELHVKSRRCTSVFPDVESAKKWAIARFGHVVFRKYTSKER